jgi:hypothetical protein
MFILILFFSYRYHFELEWMGVYLHGHGFPRPRELIFGGDCFAAKEPSKDHVVGTRVARGKGVVFMRCFTGCGWGKQGRAVFTTGLFREYTCVEPRVPANVSVGSEG